MSERERGRKEGRFVLKIQTAVGLQKTSNDCI
jgi:hypothetical protein